MGRSAQRQTNEFVATSHRTWPFVAGVASIALGAGVLIAGVPQPSEAFVMPAGVTTTTVADVDVVPVSDDRAATDVTVGDIGTGAPSTPDRSVEAASEAPSIAALAPPPAASTESAPNSTTTVRPTPERETSDRETSAPAGVSTTTTTSRPTAATVDREQVSVVVVNGADEAGLAGRAAQALAGKGYTDVATTDALRKAERTTIFYAPGFEDEAAELAAALGLWAPLEPTPGGRATSMTVNGSDLGADLVLLLGPTT